MQFRSCPAIYQPDRTIRGVWDMPEGGFFYGREQQKDGAVCQTIWLAMPYTHPAGAHSVHCLRILPARRIQQYNADGQITGYTWKQPDDVPEPPSPYWLWDGNLECPSLNPSIACGPAEKRDWHGYLTNGLLAACE